jgi:hypothetical protein
MAIEAPLACADAANDMEAEGLFDDIEYRKAGSVLRMLWNYMTSKEYVNPNLPPITGPGHAADVTILHSPSLSHCAACFIYWQEHTFAMVLLL